jgi:hypothetical protein
LLVLFFQLPAIPYPLTMVIISFTLLLLPDTPGIT